MTTWKGKLIGAGLGYFVLGPVGAIIGGLIGHGFDKEAEKKRSQEQPGWRPGPGTAPRTETYDRVRDLSNEDKQLIFVTNLATLLVSVAMADGVFRPEEERSILSFFRRNGFAGSDLDLIKRIVKEAAAKKPDLAAVCREFARISKYEDRLLLIRAVCMVAMSDREFHPAEQHAIEVIARNLGLSDMELKSVMSEFISVEDRYYQILGVSKYATDEEVKKAYREQAARYHPDRVSHLGEEFIKMAHERLEAINEAYSYIRKKRGL